MGTQPCHPFVGLRPTQQGRTRVWPIHGAPTLRKSPEQASGEQWASHSHGELSQLPLRAHLCGPTSSCPLPGSPRGRNPWMSSLTWLPVPCSRRRRDHRPLAGCRLPLQQRCCPPRHPQVGTGGFNVFSEKYFMDIDIL